MLNGRTDNDSFSWYNVRGGNPLIVHLGIIIYLRFNAEIIKYTFSTTLHDIHH